ncbi:DUF1549 domain-containing protein [Rubritalea tangerina]|uniref:DUF1549 domain-containing protein n=1 Tax=Rubritalea tangerina TaxID=430798 RepID=UPI00361F8F68
MEKEGLKHPAASKQQWLRRASLDLTGLPPPPKNLKHSSRTLSNAYENQVDRLLDSPHFGERWASIWMDLARYSDTKGYEKDPHRNIWQYRDYLIEAFNKDKPYDKFIQEQLAGDLVENPMRNNGSPPHFTVTPNQHRGWHR